MANVLTMPKLSDTMEEGGVANWLKAEGEKIKEGESLVEIETDKATMEYPSPETGFVLKHLVNPGNAVPIGAPLLVLGNKKDESFDLDGLLKEFAKVSPDAPSSSSAVAQKSLNKPSLITASTLGEAPPQIEAGVMSTATGSHAEVTRAENSDRIKASPLAKKIAREQGLALTQLRGSGPGGRIIAKDVESAPGSVRGSFVPSAGMAKRQNQEIPLSLMRKTIAKRLTSAKNEAPHFYLKRTVDMTSALVLKKELMDTLGDKISLNDIIIFAVSRALRNHPKVNASWTDNKIMQWGDIHVAMAVALEAGLVTPVIRHADTLGLLQIATQSRLLITQAKNEQLKNEDYQGGTFTISNLGMLGIEEFTAIINPPQAAILAVGAVRKEPCIDDSGSIYVCDRMTMTMSCDHRVVDGAVGAEFLKTLVAYLEKPTLMLA